LRANIESAAIHLQSWIASPTVRNDELSHIIPIIIGDEARTLEIAAKLKEQGILVAAIRPPTVPPSTSRLRISLSAKHSEQDLENLKAQLKQLC